LARCTGPRERPYTNTLAGDRVVYPFASSAVPSIYASEPTKTPARTPADAVHADVATCVKCGVGAAYVGRLAATGAEVALCTDDANALDERGEFATRSVRRTTTAEGREAAR
jgi:hypothetical protein